MTGPRTYSVGLLAWFFNGSNDVDIDEYEWENRWLGWKRPVECAATD
jgi:hypothetical protein